MKDVFGATARFNEEVCGLEPPDSPQMIDTERLVWFNHAVREELGELIEASTVEGQADAIVDLIYFAAGRLYEMGVDGGEMDRDIRMGLMERVDSFWCSDKPQKFDAVSSPFFEDIYRSNSRPTGCQHGVQN